MLARNRKKILFYRKCRKDKQMNNFLEQKVKTRINNFNIKHFNSLGYFSKLNEYIDIPAHELPQGSGIKINVSCFYCGGSFKKSYRRVMETANDLCCNKCKNIKMMKTSLNKYGNVCSLRHPKILEKSIATNKEKLGVDFPFQNKNILKKCRNTSIKKYGTKFNSSCISKPQRRIHDVFGGLLNYSEFPYRLDIFFPAENIYFEYDGTGHLLSVKLSKETEDEFYKKEFKREKFLYEMGYKQFRLISLTDKLPSKKILIKIKQKAFYILLEKKI